MISIALVISFYLERHKYSFDPLDIALMTFLSAMLLLTCLGMIAAGLGQRFVTPKNIGQVTGELIKRRVFSRPPGGGMFIIDHYHIGDIRLNLREDTEQRWLTRPRGSRGGALTTAESTRAWQRAEQDLAEWKQAHPWLADHPGIRLTSWRRRDSGPRSNHGYRIYVVAEIERTVRGELSLVYLRIMHKLAKQFGVPFEDITSDLSELRLPARLESIYDKLDTQAQGGEAALTDEEWSLLHREYIHLSSHWAPIGISAAMKPAEGYSRIIHPHTPD